MRGKPLPNSNGGGKMTVVILQISGGDATLQEGFRTIRTALENIGEKSAPKLLSSGHSGSSVSVDTPPVDTPPVEGETSDDNAQVPADAAEPKRQPKERPPQIITLDLNKNSPLVPLKEFLEKHASLGVHRRYLLCVHWLKDNLGVQEVSMDHMHTCFRHMDWTTPERPTQPLRDMKTKAYGWFDKGSGMGLYKLNHVGEGKARKIIKGEDK
jgi:hypothetical protein